MSFQATDRQPRHWRRLDQSVRRECARLYRLQAEFGARTLLAQPSADQVQSYERHGGQYRDKIQAQVDSSRCQDV